MEEAAQIGQAVSIFGHFQTRLGKALSNLI